MSDDTEHPLPIQWNTSEAYRRALAIADKARKEYIANRERERCHTADDEGRAA